MEADPLQQLRDVHTPVDPSWWPPAIGWWLLVIVAVVALVWLSRKSLTAYQQRRPIRQANALLEGLLQKYNEGAMSAEQFLHQGNELLKRLLVAALGQQSYARLSGERWLAELDQLTGTTQFSTGPGQILGNLRFTETPEVDVKALHQALRLVINKVQP